MGVRLCPIFQVSNVMGEGLDFVCCVNCCSLSPVDSTVSQVRTFWNLLPLSEADQEKFAIN
jgi:hypothetical protein